MFTDKVIYVFISLPDILGTMSLHCVCGVFVFLSLCLISIPPRCHGGNVLVFPFDGSHWINMKILLEELDPRGHNLTVIREDNSWYIPEKSPLYTSITFDLKEGLEDIFDAFVQEHMKREGASRLTFFKDTLHLFSMLPHAHSLWTDATIKMFEDQNMMNSLKNSNYDLVLTDPAVAPGLVLAKYLKLPVVLNVRWITSGDGHFVLAPSPLSYIPVPGSGLTDKMNFIQRVKNMLFHSIILFQQKFVLGPCYETLCNKYIEGGCDIISLLQEDSSANQPSLCQQTWRTLFKVLGSVAILCSKGGSRLNFLF
uniref:UDP glucuronosyltransferase 5 family, polypeptide D1 n=1 Tax=Amphiprion percula TaxID=161767 RepID=A0A3P8U0X2_AMPPE